MTPPQEKFARLVAEGSNQADAYREAYPRSRKWTDKAVWEKASHTAALGKVKARVAELRRAANAKTALKIGEMQTILSDRIRELVAANGATADLCRAADSLARISGWNAPEAVLAAAVVISPEERARRVREALGIPEGAME